jgi:hypothetical protein
MNLLDNYKETLSNCPNDTCGAGIDNYGTTAVLDNHDDSVVICNCPKCRTTWYICRYCTGSYVYHLIDKQAVSLHMRRSHKELLPSSLNKKKRKKPPPVSVKNSIRNTQSSIPTPSNKESNPLVCLTAVNKGVTLPNLPKSILFDVTVEDDCSDIGVDFPSMYSSDEDAEVDGCSSNLYDQEDEKDINDDAMFLVKTFDGYKADQSSHNNSNNNHSIVFYEYNSSTSKYYAAESKNIHSGIRYLIANAFQLPHAAEELSHEEVKFHLLNTRFLLNLTRSQQNGFSDVINAMQSLYSNPSVQSLLPYQVKCQLPDSYNDIRRIIIRGKKSILNNIPIPETMMLTRHSYTKLDSCISHFLLQPGTRLIESDSPDIPAILPNSIFNTKVCNKILSQAQNRFNQRNLPPNLSLATVFIIVWSDGFDPNKSTKSDRQSAWTMTVTLFVMDATFQPIYSTYPFAFGKEDTCHNEVYFQFYLELRTLRGGDFLVMYSSHLKKPVAVHADIFVVSNDQPERRSTLKLSGGNSLFHNCWGYSCMTKNLVDVLKPCDKCNLYNNLEATLVMNNYSELIAKDGYYDWCSKVCSQCTNWWKSNKSELLKVVPPKDFAFPKDKLDDTGRLIPMEINFPNIQAAITYVHDSVIANNLKKTKQ